MINKIQKFIKEENLFSNNNILLLALSGGPDSICLFFILHELGYNINLAHCNFNLRGQESDAEEAFVKELADTYSVNLFTRSFETEVYANKHNISIQMAARSLRYNWFDNLMKTQNFDYILTGHNSDDNVETFLINIIRGTGIDGLSGIKAKNKNIIRPLIQTSRKEIESYLHMRKIKYCNDTSNLDIKYTRNKIRHQLIPLIKEINPSIKQTIINEIAIMNSISKVFKKQINEIRSSLVKRKNNNYKINISSIIKLENSEIILFELLKPFGFLEIKKIIKAMKSQSGKQFFSNNYHLIIDREDIIIVLLERNDDNVSITKEQRTIDNPLKIKFMYSLDCTIAKDLNIGKFDAEKISFPLTIRKWRKGDKFKPLGMSNFKKLSDFFIDEKYSIINKQQQWLLCSANDIIWIVGNRIDDRYKIRDHTKKVYIAEILKD